MLHGIHACTEGPWFLKMLCLYRADLKMPSHTELHLNQTLKQTAPKLIISQGKWSITQGSCTFSNYFNQQNPPSSTQQGEIHKVRNLKVILPMVAEEAYHRPKQYTVGLSPLHFRPWLLRLYFCTWLLWSQVKIYECLNFPHTAACLHSQTRSWDDQSDW